MLSIEAIKSTVPVANIKSIILQNPSSTVGSGTGMVVRVKATAITTANELGFDTSASTAFLSVPKLEFNSHLGVALIQSTSTKLTSLLQSFGTNLLKYIGPANQWKGNAAFDSFLSHKLGNSVAIPDFKAKFMEVIHQPLFGNIESPILEKIDNNGQTIKTVPLEFEFSVDKQTPTHLTYFIVSFLDINGIVEEVNSQSPFPDSDGAPTLGLNTVDLENLTGLSSPVKNDTIFQAGILSGHTSFFQLPNGKFWTGPVEKEGGTYQTDTKIPLTVREARNVKIQDFRNLEPLEAVEVMSDFTGEKEQLRLILENFKPRIRTLDPSRNKPHPYISELFSSIGVHNKVNLMFMINFEDMLFSNSIYGELWKTVYADIKQQIFEFSAIKSLRVYRQQVEEEKGTNSIGSPVQRLTPVQGTFPELIAVSGQSQNSSTLTEVANFKEETKMTLSEGTSIRCFSITDSSIPESSISQYRYYVEMDLYDGSSDFLKSKVQVLQKFLYTLENYLSDIMNSTLRNDSAAGDDQLRREGYSPQFGNLTEGFATKMRGKYQTRLKAGVASFLEVISLFTPDNTPSNTELDEVGFSVSATQEFMNMILNPSHTNPESIGAALQIVATTISQILSFVGEDLASQDPAAILPASSPRSTSKRCAMISKQFSQAVDMRELSSGGYDYLSSNLAVATSEPNNLGLRDIGGIAFRQRVQSETLKYYVQTQPDLTTGLTSDKKSYGGTVTVGYREMSYLSPSQVFVGPTTDKTIDLLGFLKTNERAIVLESQIVNNTLSQRNSVVASTVPDQFSVTFKKAWDNKERKFSPPQQVSFFEENMNLIKTPLRPPGAPVVNASQSTTEDGEVLVIFGGDGKTRTAPASLYQSLFNKRMANTEPDREKYDINNTSNFLESMTTDQVRDLPNQIKALFQSSTGAQSEVNPTNRAEKNLLSDPSLSAISTFRYKMIVEIQCLVQFDKLDGRYSLSSPIWTTLDEKLFSSFVDKKVLCRLVEYSAPPEFGLNHPEDLKMHVHDRYFTLSPDTMVTNPVSVGATESTSFINHDYEFVNSDFDGSPEFGMTYLPTSPPKPVDPRILNAIDRLKHFTNKLSENSIMDAFHSIPGSTKKSSTSPSDSMLRTDEIAILSATQKATSAKLAKLNKTIDSTRGLLKAKEREASLTTANIVSNSFTSSEKAQLQQKSVSIAQEMNSLRVKLANDEQQQSAAKEALNIANNNAESFSSGGKSYTSVEDPNNVSQVGPPNQTFTSTEQLMTDYGLLISSIEHDASLGIVKEENIDKLQKYSGYIAGQDGDTEQFSNEIESIKISSQEPDTVVKNAEELQQKELVTSSGTVVGKNQTNRGVKK